MLHLEPSPAEPDVTEVLVAALHDAKLQIEYLHEKFRETGTGNAILARINIALSRAGASQ